MQVLDVENDELDAKKKKERERERVLPVFKDITYQIINSYLCSLEILLNLERT